MLLPEWEEEEILVDGSVVVAEQVLALSLQVDSILLALAWNSMLWTLLVSAWVDAGV